MADLVYNNTLLDAIQGDLDLAEGVEDIRVALLSTNTTADIEEEVALMNGFTTLDEHDGTSYTRKTLSSQAVAIDTSNDRAEFDCEDLTWSSLGNGTREIQGLLFLNHVTNDTDSVPRFFQELPATVNPGGGNLTVTQDAEGALHVQQGT